MVFVKSFFPIERIRLTGIILLSLLFSVLLIACRVYFTHKITFVFLVWNLILAFVPFLISSIIISTKSKSISKWTLGILFVVWLIFFPNAPYILTDLFHLKQRTGVPLWFDLIVILSAAWNGLILGLLSLDDLHGVISKRFSKAAGWLFVFGSLFLCGFGIYIGRYLRWNSWDVITNPITLFQELFNQLLHPTLHPRLIGVSVLYMAFLMIAFLFIKQIKSNSDIKIDSL
jgi:uncharacterized membrane protein